MIQPKSLSINSIKETFKSKSDSFFGSEGFVTLKAEKLIGYFCSSGEPVKTESLNFSLCVSGEMKSEVNIVDETTTQGDFELFLPGTLLKLDSISDECSIIGVSFSPFYIQEIFPEEAMSAFYRLNNNRKIKLCDGPDNPAVLGQDGQRKGFYTADD